MRKVHSPQEMKQGSCDSGFALINANSIHHSYNKCVTIHSTQNVIIQNNVCARIVGHIFYEEVGDAANITFKHNLGLGAMSNYFDINNGTDMCRDALITQLWWPGMNLANLPNLTEDGFLIKDTDNQHNGTAGQCFKFEPNKTININGSFVPDTTENRGRHRRAARAHFISNRQRFLDHQSQRDTRRQFYRRVPRRRQGILV